MIQVRDLELIFHYHLLLSKTFITNNVRLGQGSAVGAASPHSYSEGQEVNPAVRGFLATSLALT